MAGNRPYNVRGLYALYEGEPSFRVSFLDPRHRSPPQRRRTQLSPNLSYLEAGGRTVLTRARCATRHFCCGRRANSNRRPPACKATTAGPATCGDTETRRSGRPHESHACHVAPDRAGSRTASVLPRPVSQGLDVAAAVTQMATDVPSLPWQGP